MNERKHYIDWLRVIAIAGVFVYHCTRFFDTEDWNVKAPVAQQSEILPMVRQVFVWLWLMELFFFLAGFATWYALKKRTTGQYLLERVKRLLIPLYTVGLFIIVVPQAYLDGFTHGKITSSFWQWLPGYYAGLPGQVFHTPDLRDPIQLLPYGFWGHLWFIGMLVLVTLAALPVILYLRTGQGQRLIAALAGWAGKPGGIFLFVIALAAGRIALYWIPSTTDRTWGDFVWYLLFFVSGYMVAADARFSESIKKNGWLCLGLWLGVFMVVGGVFAGALQINVDSWDGFSAPFVIWQIVYSLTSWSAVVFLLSVGAKYLNFNNRLLQYSSEAVLPFYIFHQTVILIVGWFVMPVDMGAWAKFLIVSVVSFPVIMLLYEMFVRHIHFMRFLFGMAPKKKQVAVKREVAAAVK